MTERIFHIAESLIRDYGTANPYELCRLLDIALIFTDLPESIDGFYMEREGRQAIVIDGNLSGIKARLCAAHELGHALLHKDMNSFFITESTFFSSGRFEREADLFAAALVLRELSPGDCTRREQLAAVTGLPAAIIDSFFEYSCKSA